jgi:hypothetical protein
LSLCGTWLSDAGFKPDDSALVVIYPNMLVIHHIKSDEMVTEY